MRRCRACSASLCGRARVLSGQLGRMSVCDCASLDQRGVRLRVYSLRAPVLGRPPRPMLARPPREGRALSRLVGVLGAIAG
jgi:hypothetical protein